MAAEELERFEFRSRLKTTEEMKGRPRPASLVRSLITRDGFGRLVAEAGAYKSFVALDLMMSITHNVPSWFGLDIYKHGNVVYVMTEGSFDYPERVAAWELGHPEFPHVAGQDIYVLDQEDLDLADEESFTRLFFDDITRDRMGARSGEGEWHIDGINPVLLVIDTQRGALPNTNEDKNDEMNPICYRLKNAATDLECAVMLVHHTPVSTDLQHRGSGAGAVRANCDFEFSIKKGKLEMTKNKFGPAWPAHKINANVVTIEDVVDEGGKPVTSCWLNLVPAKANDFVRDVDIDRHEEEVRQYIIDNPGKSKSVVSDAVYGNHKADATAKLEELNGKAYTAKGDKYLKLYPVE